MVFHYIKIHNLDGNAKTMLQRVIWMEMQKLWFKEVEKGSKLSLFVFCSSCKILYIARSVHPRIATDVFFLVPVLKRQCSKKENQNFDSGHILFNSPERSDSPSTRGSGGGSSSRGSHGNSSRSGRDRDRDSYYSSSTSSSKYSRYVE